MHARIDGEITLTDYTPAQANEIKKKLQLPNKDYWKRIKMNPRAKHFLSPYVPFYREDSKTGALIIPRGAGKWLAETFRITWEDRRAKAPIEFPRFQGTIREYQQGIPECLAGSNQGLAVLPTGFGKTIIAFATASLLGQKTLFLVHNKNGLGQFRADAKAFLDVELGSLGAGNIDIATFASVLSKIRRGETAALRTYGAVFFDEAQFSPAGKTREIWRHIPAHFRFGLTGTPDRDDGLGEAIHFIFGETLVERTMERAKPRVLLHHYQGAIAMGPYHEIASHLAESRERNREIAQILQARRAGRKSLVLTKRVEHARRIASFLPADTKVVEVRSDTKARAKLLAELRKNPDSYDVILGTFSLLGTGLDIPSLDTLVIAGDLKSRVLSRQAIGRIERLMAGKPQPEVHDIVDRQNPILYNQARVRQKLYKENNWPIEVCDDLGTVSSELGLQTLFGGF